MIAIKFNPKYEDRVNIYFKQENIKKEGVLVKYIDPPIGHEKKQKAYWKITYGYHGNINYILSLLHELKGIMGVEDLEFSYYTSDREYYTQQDSMGFNINWLQI